MNFLLHRHFARIELGSPAAGVGAMLPDLWRMAHRGMRARAGAHADTGSVRWLQQGVAHHLAADVWFHKTEPFLRGERELARALAGLGIPKLVLFAHPAWELCLDGALLARGHFEGELGSLRADVRSVEGSLGAIAALHGASTLEPPEQLARGMERLLEGLLDGRWLTAYQSGHGLARCVGGMRRRLGLPAFAEEDEALVASALEDALERADGALTELCADRERVLSEELSPCAE